MRGTRYCKGALMLETTRCVESWFEEKDVLGVGDGGEWTMKECACGRGDCLQITLAGFPYIRQ
jgi:hypothetical protein